ncbi:TadE/TadG family type IV pilus assembly protein [Lysobacter sp. F60174L2]|uniref:TadE/TadG family type IV pilus assembly protein n=1 Tax=Lysobacter sp. F60174L2 TaxID=3459295 RepID=UPI00403DBF13
MNPLRYAPSTSANQRGQAMTEVAVLAAVLVPLFLLIPVMAKYVHLRQANLQAARAAAWDATVATDYKLPGRAATQSDLINRHFAAADAPIRSNPPRPPRNGRLGDVFLNTFSNQPLLTAADIRLRSYTDKNAPGFLNRIGNILRGLPGEFPPNKNGLVTATVTVDPQNLRTQNGAPARYLAPFDNINLRMSASHTLLVDAWNAKGPGHGRNPHPRSVNEQVRTLVPTSYIDGLDKVVDSLSFLEGFPFIGVPTRLEIGYREPDIVPHDRLEPYVRNY